MNRSDSTTASGKILHRVFAAAFLLVLLVEWGSHSLAFAHAAPPEGVVAVSSEHEHEDPCKTMIHCSESRRQDQVPNPGHDRIQQNSTSFGNAEIDTYLVSNRQPGIFREDANRLFRSIDPPFQPPELS